MFQLTNSLIRSRKLINALIRARKTREITTNTIYILPYELVIINRNNGHSMSEVGKLKITNLDEYVSETLIKSFTTTESIFEKAEIVELAQIYNLLDLKHKPVHITWKDLRLEFDDETVLFVTVSEKVGFHHKQHINNEEKIKLEKKPDRDTHKRRREEQTVKIERKSENDKIAETLVSLTQEKKRKREDKTTVIHSHKKRLKTQDTFQVQWMQSTFVSSKRVPLDSVETESVRFDSNIMDDIHCTSLIDSHGNVAYTLDKLYLEGLDDNGYPRTINLLSKTSITYKKWKDIDNLRLDKSVLHVVRTKIPIYDYK